MDSDPDWQIQKRKGHRDKKGSCLIYARRISMVKPYRLHFPSRINSMMLNNYLTNPSSDIDHQSLEKGCIYMQNLTSLLIVSLICFWSPSAPVYALERHQYVEKTGASRSVFSWEANASRETMIRVRQSNTLFVNYCDQSGATLKWHYQSASAGIRVNRLGNRLHMTGTNKGKKVNRYLQVNDSPW